MSESLLLFVVDSEVVVSFSVIDSATTVVVTVDSVVPSTSFSAVEQAVNPLLSIQII